jgi:hypothetical protein
MFIQKAVYCNSRWIFNCIATNFSNIFLSEDRIEMGHKVCGVTSLDIGTVQLVLSVVCYTEIKDVKYCEYNYSSISIFTDDLHTRLCF